LEEPKVVLILWGVVWISTLNGKVPDSQDSSNWLNRA